MKLKEKLNKINKGKIKKTIKTFLSICLLTIIEVSICVFFALFVGQRVSVLILQACQFNHNPNTFELIFMVGVPVMFIMGSLFYLFIRWSKLLYNKLVKGARR